MTLYRRTRIVCAQCGYDGFPNNVTECPECEDDPDCPDCGKHLTTDSCPHDCDCCTCDEATR